MPNCKNIIGIPLQDKFDEMSIEFGQNSVLDGDIEVMVYYPPDYEMMGMFPDEVDDRVGTQKVIVRSVAELYTLLDEVMAQDYTRFNVTSEETEENQDD